MRGGRLLFCGLLLVTLSTSALAKDSLTARIPVAIAAGDYAEAEMLIAEAVKIGLLSSAAAQSYRGEIQRASERAVANQQDKNQRVSPQQSTKEKPSLDRPPLPYKPSLGKQGRIYVTYTKFNRKVSRYYSGRTSMVVDLRKPLDVEAAEAVRLRDGNHHVDENDEPQSPAFDAAQVDEFDVGTAVDYSERYNDLAYWRIRGREQQLIDYRGGAQSDTGMPYRTENVLRAVAKDNRLGRQFYEAATVHWGQLYGYTGE